MNFRASDAVLHVRGHGELVHRRGRHQLCQRVTRDPSVADGDNSVYQDVSRMVHTLRLHTQHTNASRHTIPSHSVCVPTAALGNMTATHRWASSTHLGNQNQSLPTGNHLSLFSAALSPTRDVLESTVAHDLVHHSEEFVPKSATAPTSLGAQRWYQFDHETRSQQLSNGANQNYKRCDGQQKHPHIQIKFTTEQKKTRAKHTKQRLGDRSVRLFCGL